MSACSAGHVAPAQAKIAALAPAPRAKNESGTAGNERHSDIEDEMWIERSRRRHTRNRRIPFGGRDQHVEAVDDVKDTQQQKQYADDHGFPYDAQA